MWITYFEQIERIRPCPPIHADDPGLLGCAGDAEAAARPARTEGSVNHSLMIMNRELSLLAKINSLPSLFRGMMVALPRITPDGVPFDFFDLDRAR